MQVSRVDVTFRNHLITGLVVLFPLGVTFLVLRFLFRIMSSILSPLIRSAGVDLSGAALNVVSIASLVVLVYLVGLFAAHIAGRRVIGWAERLINRVPLVKIVYSGAKDVVQALSTQRHHEFKRAVILEHPREGMYALGFVTGTIQSIDGETLLKVFIPTSPNPTTGFFQLVPRRMVQETDMAVEEAVKTLVSAGTVSPVRLRSADGPIEKNDLPNT
jgi:uncharacterized membrane protein